MNAAKHSTSKPGKPLRKGLIRLYHDNFIEKTGSNKWSKFKNWMKRNINLYTGVVIGTYVVFICNMAISYLHAWELYQGIGYFPGVFSHIAVVAFDTVFALAVLIISIGLMKKKRIGWQVWVAFLFGLAMTTWSNVRASMGEEWIYLVTGQFNMITSKGWESLVAGISTPTALVAVEFLLGWMVANKDAFIEKLSHAESSALKLVVPEYAKPIVDHTQNSFSQKSHTQDEKETLTMRVSHNDDLSHTQEDDDTLTQSHAHNKDLSREAHTQEDSHTHKESHTDDPHSVRTSHTEELSQAHTTKESSENANSHNSHSITLTHSENKGTLADTDQVSHDDSHKEESHTENDPHTHRESHTKTENDSHSVRTSHKGKNSHNQSHTTNSHNQRETFSQNLSQEFTQNEEGLTPREHAERIKKERGKYPSIRELKNIAGCSEWEARKTLQELKKKVS